MALFITAENQNILWEMINKVPLCNVVFPSGSQNNKNNWFKNIIQEYYNRTPPNVTRNDLYKINRDVLSYMVKQLGELERANVSHISEFETRQTQYKNMFEVQKPQTIDFSEKIDDEVITNMNELIENHKKMREQDLLEILPMQPIAQPTIRINISNDIPKEVIHIENNEGDNSNEKHVRFTLPEKNENESINNKLDILILKFENIESKINDIYNLLDVKRMDDISIYNNDSNVEAIKRIM